MTPEQVEQERKFESWWKCLPTLAYDPEVKELYKHAYLSGMSERCGELEEALRRYGQHELIDGVRYCAYFDNKPCTCGLDEVLASTATSKPGVGTPKPHAQGDTS